MAIEIKSSTAISRPGDSIAEFKVGSREQYRFLYGCLILSTSGDAADRRATMEIYDANDILVIRFRAGAIVKKSKANQEHIFAQGLHRETAFIKSSINIPVGFGTVIPAGWECRFSIENGQPADNYVLAFVVSAGHAGAQV